MKRIVYHIIIVSFLTVVCEGCTSRKLTNGKFPQVERLRADSIVVPPLLLAVNYLFTTDNMLVAYEPKKDTLFSFWKLPRCNYLFSAGRKGNGPHEFLTLDRSFMAIPGGFKTFEIASNRVKYISINQDGDLHITQTQQLRTNRTGLNRFLFLEDSSYCFISDKEEYEYTLLNKRDLRDFSHYPEGLLEKEKGEMNRFTYNKLTIAHPDGKRFAAFYAYLKLCRVYNSKGELLKETFIDAPGATNSERKKVYYSSFPCTDGHFIYILTDNLGTQILEVWTWDGVPKAHYLLDKPVHYIAVSAIHHQIYAVNKEKEGLIYTYKLPVFISG